MKVVLFCGGQGTRLRDYAENIPKPMVPVGYRPILWQVMRYYAHFGHKDFILALGYKAEHIRAYFTDCEDWHITFVDTGMEANIGMRLVQVRELLQKEELFLANYADGLSDLPLPRLVDRMRREPHLAACFATYPPPQSFHLVSSDAAQLVRGIHPMQAAHIWLNIGYFVFRPSVFDFIHYGEELVEAPFQRLIEANKLASYQHQGFWQAMDTYKDKLKLDTLQARGLPPWEIWNHPNSQSEHAVDSI